MAIDAVTRFLHRKTLGRLRRRIRKGDVVEAVTPGTHEGKAGALVLTSRAMYWVPERGRITVRPRNAVHDVRGNGHSGLVDSQQPSWQLRDAPSGSAREMANASRAPISDSGPDRAHRLDRLLALGRITQSEYDWMLKEE